MKKIVIGALLSGLVGLASAQLTVNGTTGYEVRHSPTGTVTGLHDSAVKLTAKEDLGSGLSATAELAVNGFGGRGNAFVSEDASVTLAGGFGAIKAGEVEAVNGIIGRGYAGGAFIGSDGKVLGGPANKQFVGYTTPAFGDLKLTASSTQDINGTGPRAYSFGAVYDLGPVSAGADYNQTSKRVRTSGTVDLKMVKLGAGYSFNEANVANSFVVSAVAPVGSLNLGISYANGNGSAKEVAAAYSLSKRTVLAVAYQNVTNNSIAANNVGTTRLRVTHTF